MRPLLSTFKKRYADLYLGRSSLNDEGEANNSFILCLASLGTHINFINVQIIRTELPLI